MVARKGFLIVIILLKQRKDYKEIHVFPTMWETMNILTFLLSGNTSRLVMMS